MPRLHPTIRMNPAITIDLICEAVERSDSEGFCLACGQTAFGVEPDARQYECECCGENAVYGAEELLLMVA